MAATFNDANVSDPEGLRTTDLEAWLKHYPLFNHATSKVFMYTPQGSLRVTLVEMDEHGDILITSEDA